MQKHNKKQKEKDKDIDLKLALERHYLGLPLTDKEVSLIRKHWNLEK